jgi:hypothetical protein
LFGVDIPANEPECENGEEDAEDDPFDYYAFLFIVSNTSTVATIKSMDPELGRMGEK